jgi:hypothetical protein
MLVEHADGNPVTQITRDGLFLFALEDGMVTVRKCQSPNVPIQQAKFGALQGAPVGVGGCGCAPEPGVGSCPFCKGETNPFGGLVAGMLDSCGHTHPIVCLPDPPNLPSGGPCEAARPHGLPHVPGPHGKDAVFAGLGQCLPDPPAFPDGGPCRHEPIPGVMDLVHPLKYVPNPMALGAPPAYAPVAPGSTVPIASSPNAASAAGATPPFAYQHTVQPALAPDGKVTALTYVPTPMQMPMRPPGKMAYQPTLPWWTAWHKDEQQAFNCWWVNQQFAHPVCGLGAAANLPTTPDFDNLRWVIRMGIPWNVDGALGQTPAQPSAWKTAGRLLGIVAASVAAAGAVTVLAPMVVGAAVLGGQAKANPRRNSKRNPRGQGRISPEKKEHLFRILDLTFGSPTNQRRGFPTEDAAAFSAATLLEGRTKASFPSRVEVVKEWYRRR